MSEQSEAMNNFKLTTTHKIIIGGVLVALIAFALWSAIGGTATNSKTMNTDFGSGNTIGTVDQSEKNTTDNSKKVDTSVDTSTKSTSETNEGNEQPQH